MGMYEIQQVAGVRVLESSNSLISLSFMCFRL